MVYSSDSRRAPARENGPAARVSGTARAPSRALLVPAGRALRSPPYMERIRNHSMEYGHGQTTRRRAMNGDNASWTAPRRPYEVTTGGVASPRWIMLWRVMATGGAAPLNAGTMGICWGCVISRPRRFCGCRRSGTCWAVAGQAGAAKQRNVLHMQQGSPGGGAGSVQRVRRRAEVAPGAEGGRLRGGRPVHEMRQGAPLGGSEVVRRVRRQEGAPRP